MKRSVLLLMAIGFSLSMNSIAQEKEKDFGIKFSGFIKNDFFFDSRQTVSAREGHFLLWPSPVLEDANGNDVNARSSFNFLAIQSRLRGTITGPDAFGAKTSGVLEGDFFAQANANINLFRLRHAFIKLNWPNTEILTGQYWNPMFVTGCFPGTVSFNTGVPMQSFARNPQIRLTQRLGDFQIILAALAQRDFASRGPDPINNATSIASSEFLRNSSVPDMHVQVHYNIKAGESGSNILLGAGGAYKTIRPRISSVMGTDVYKVNEKLSGFTAIAFSKLTFKPLTVKLQGRYGENISDLLSISGFALKNVDDPVSGESSYTPFKNVSVWGEVHSNGSKIQVGIFGGYLKNMGTKEEMSSADNAVYGLGTNIASLLRVSPRIIFIANKLKIACEVEITTAAYGRDFDEFCMPSATTDVTNTRVLLSAMYSF